MIKTQHRFVRIVRLGQVALPDMASVDLAAVLRGQDFQPAGPVRCEQAQVAGDQFIAPGQPPIPIKGTSPAKLSIRAATDAARQIWQTHLMCLKDGQVLAAAQAPVPDTIPFEHFKVMHTKPTISPPPTGLAAGTRIATPTGLVEVQNLQRGDPVTTLDHGTKRLVAVDQVEDAGVFGQIEIDRTIIGPKMPTRRLRIARGSLLLARNAITGRMFDALDVMIHAERLIDLHGIRLQAGADGSLYQLRFAEPQLFLAEGVAVGSTHNPGEDTTCHARMIPSLARQRALALRMWRNGVRTCAGNRPARSRTERKRAENAHRRAAVAARVLPFAKSAPQDFNVG